MRPSRTPCLADRDLVSCVAGESSRAASGEALLAELRDLEGEVRAIRAELRRLEALALADVDVPLERRRSF